MKNNSISFEEFHRARKDFIKLNNIHDHVVVKGNNILLSAPHGVPQVRLGKSKVAEIGSLSTAIAVQSGTGATLIAKTRCNNDDANFDINSPYKDTICEMVAQREIEYVIDFHGLASHRDCDINLGVHLGKNIETNNEIFERLVYALESNGFEVSIDQPFMAGSGTVSGAIKNTFPRVWTIQIEINCAITNNKKNISKCRRLIDILVYWINSIKGER